MLIHRRCPGVIHGTWCVYDCDELLIIKRDMLSSVFSVVFSCRSANFYTTKKLIDRSGFEITTGHHCGLKYSEKSLLHSDDWLLFRTLQMMFIFAY